MKVAALCHIAQKTTLGTMSGLIGLISYLVFTVYSTHGQTGPTLTCIDASGTESAPPCMVDENVGVYMVKVTLTQAIASQLVVQGVISEAATIPTNQGNGLATATSDYGVVNFPLSVVDVASAPTDFTIAISIVDDTEVEPTEEFIITVQTSSDTLTCTTCSFVIRIVDNDGPTLPEISLSQATYTVCEGDEVIVGVTRGSDGGTTAVNVEVSVREITAKLVVDFTFEMNPTMVSVNSGATEFFAIPTIADNVDEGGVEMFEISIDQDPMNPATYMRSTVAGTVSTALAEINDPSNVSPTFWIEYSDYQATEDSTPFTFNVKRSSTGSTATITFSTSDVSTSTATGVADYVAVSGQQITFDVNSDTAVGSVVIISDTSFEGAEIFEITISNPSIGGLSNCMTRTAAVTLQDAFTTPTFLLSRALFSVLESSTATVDIEVRREGDTSLEGSVLLASSDAVAVDPTDYMAISKRVMFAANEDTKTESITIVNDNIIEPTKLFMVTLSDPTGGVIGTPSSASVAITDDDYCYSLTSTQYSAPESAGSLDISVTKTGYLEDLSTSFSLLTTDDTASLTEDFTAATTSFAFARGESVVNALAFVLVQNDGFEGQEQFTVTLTATVQTRICQPSTATVTIQDSDFLCTPMCVNGGTCTGTNQCTCPTGFTGATCSEGVCNPTCANGGSCTGPNICMCIADFTGATCTEAVATTSAFLVVLPIVNLRDSTAAFTVALYDRTSQAFILLEIDVCFWLGNAIRNGNPFSSLAVCFVRSFSPGSIISEVDIMVTTSEPENVTTTEVASYIDVQYDTDPGILGLDITNVQLEEVECPADYCLNGGTCLLNADLQSYRCQCLDGFEGDQCETVTTGGGGGGDGGGTGTGTGTDSNALSAGGFVGIIIGALCAILIIGVLVFLFLRAVNRSNPNLYMPNDAEQRQRILQQGRQPAILVDDGVIRYRYYVE